jgi:hypothetical protein
MTFGIVFWDRRFQRVQHQPQLRFSPPRYSWRAIGGPDKATFTVAGAREDLYNLLTWMRYAVEIQDGGHPVWWGYLSKVEIRDGNATATADLDLMYNRVAVAYTAVASGQGSVGARGTTDWAEDDRSVAEFGRRELLDSRSGTTAAHAEQWRDLKLQRSRYPGAYVKIGQGVPGAAGEITATLTCYGWWYTLDWRYVSFPTRLAFGYQTIGTLEQTLGKDYADDAENVEALAQSFTTGAAALNVLEVAIYLKRTGSPGDLTVRLCEYIAEDPDPDPEDPAPEDAYPAPGAVLASATIASASVPTTAGWVKVSFGSSLLLATTTRYFLSISYADDPNGDNYYTFYLDGNQGYSAGILKKQVWNATVWSDGPAGDMPFRLYTNDLIETSQQVETMLVAYGQFFRSVAVRLDSGISTESYRNGDTDALVEVEEHLTMGTSNKRRMLAAVDRGRNVEVYEEPVSGLTDLKLTREGKFFEGDVEVPASRCPAGHWARLANVLPATLNVSQLSGLSEFFIERFEFDAATGKSNYEVFGERDYRDLSEMEG